MLLLARRRPAGGATCAVAPWPNAGRGRGTRHPSVVKALNVAFQPICPRARIPVMVGVTSSISRRSQWPQVARSAGVGALPGGAHRTAETILAPGRSKPAPAGAEGGWVGERARGGAARRQGPGRGAGASGPGRGGAGAGGRGATRRRLG